jgi:thiol-disulfide isomerase/thioredoxin
MKSSLAPALGLAIAIAVAGAQKKPAPSVEQQELDRALSEAGASPVEYLRAIENHLRKYPESPRRAELERAAARAAIDANDDRAIIQYGERVLSRQPDDLTILERVTSALLSTNARDAWQRAFAYARRYEQRIASLRKERPNDPAWQDQTDRSLARALCYQARATGNLGEPDQALALAQRAFEQFPNAEAAREIARWQEKLGNYAAAASAMADAFTIPDSQNTDASRARDRVRLGELYLEARGSDAGLGDLVLAAYDRNLALVRAREMRLRANDANAERSDPMEFVLSGPGGRRLEMAMLKGKIVVLDFWATWCSPCRVQHPLYEQVEKRFEGNPDVVFLSVNTDEDHGLVPPFLAMVKWTEPVYYEDGLSRALAVTSLPTTLVIDRQGAVFSRIAGFSPESFFETLTARIRAALER